MDSCIDGIINNNIIDGIKVEFLLPVIQMRSQELAQRSCSLCGVGDTAVAKGARMGDPAQPKMPQPGLQKSSLHVVLRFGGNQRQKETQAGSAGAREGKQTLWLF